MDARSGAAGRTGQRELGWASEDSEMYVIVNDLVREQTGKNLVTVFFNLVWIPSQLVL